MWISKKDYTSLLKRVQELKWAMQRRREERDEFEHRLSRPTNEILRLSKRLDELPGKLGYQALNIPEMQAETVYIKVK